MDLMTTPTRRFLRRFFKPAARYPADPRVVFILALSVFGGLGALALNAAPESLEAVLPSWAVVTWGILLVLGSALALIGILIKTNIGVLIEQVGSVIVGVTTVYYSTIAILLVGADALQNIGIILAWGLACFIRWGQLQVLINDVIGHAIRLRLQKEIEDQHDGRST